MCSVVILQDKITVPIAAYGCYHRGRPVKAIPNLLASDLVVATPAPDFRERERYDVN